MKPFRPIPAIAFAIAAATVFAASPPPALGIPNVVTGGFFNMAGMRFEDFAKRPQTWKQDAPLEGKWEIWNDPAITGRDIELLKLSLSAIVFGVPASEVTAQRREGQNVRFSVVFRPDSPGEASRLVQTVRTNAATWAGGDRDDACLRAGAAEVRWEEGDDGSVTAIFTPKKKSPADPS